jgi:hypothetical protein
LELNNTPPDISVSGIGNIRVVTSERIPSSKTMIHLRHCCYHMSAAYLFLRIVGSSHLEMLATEQRANIIFCTLLLRSPSKTLQMLKEAYGKAVMKEAQVYKRHKRLERVRNVERRDRGKSIHEIAADVGMSVGSVHSILHNDVNTHDNVAGHRSLVKKYLTKHNVTSLEHPSYSPELSPPDFFLLPRLKGVLKGK